MLAGIHPHETYTCLLWGKKKSQIWRQLLCLQGHCGAKSLTPTIWEHKLERHSSISDSRPLDWVP